MGLLLLRGRYNTQTSFGPYILKQIYASRFMHLAKDFATTRCNSSIWCQIKQTLTYKVTKQDEKHSKVNKDISRNTACLFVRSRKKVQQYNKRILLSYRNIRGVNFLWLESILICTSPTVKNFPFLSILSSKEDIQTYNISYLNENSVTKQGNWRRAFWR